MKLKPLREILAMTSQEVDEALAPMRARQVQAKADLEIAKLEETLVTLERSISEQCSRTDINFSTVIDKMNDHDLAQRRVEQLKQIVEQLFPAELVVVKNSRSRK